MTATGLPRAPWYEVLPHVFSALVAAIAFFAIVFADVAVQRARVRAGASRLAPLTFTQKWKGEAAPLALLEHDDILPLYGSSELIVEMPNRAAEFFAGYPTGFSVAPLGDRGYPILSMALGAASLGSALKGKRVAVSLSATWFIGDDTLNDPAIFRNHYSELQAGDLLFSHDLPIALKRRFAARISSYPRVTRDFPLLNPVVRCLERQCALEPLVAVLSPIWAIRALFLHDQDYRQIAMVVSSSPEPVRHPSKIDWAALETRADSEWRVRSGTNSFGIVDSLWQSEYLPAIVRTKGSSSDTSFLGQMAAAARWQDLDLLLASLKALGARPLILNSPLKGVWWDYRGVSLGARQRFYETFDARTRSYGFATRTFTAADSDRNFLAESRSHLSGKGWLEYDRIMNAFVHDSLH